MTASSFQRRTWRAASAALVFLGLALAAALVPTSASWVERTFSAGLYPQVQRHLTAWSNRVPFALFDAALIAVGVVAVVGLWYVGRDVRRRGVIGLATLAVGASVAYLVFLGAWGLNYRRTPLRDALSFDAARVTPPALRQLAAHATEELNALYRRLPTAWPEWDELRPALGPAFGRAVTAVGGRRPVTLGEPKPTLLRAYFRRTAVVGMINPYALEVLIDDEVLPFERPFVVAHEWGHLVGRAHEAEASFVGWLACLYGPAWARYSAWLSLYGTIVNGLAPRERAAVIDELDVGPRGDLDAIRRRVLSRSTPTMRRAGRAVYDRFLKANRLEEGVSSYGLVVQLMLGTSIETPLLEP